MKAFCSPPVAAARILIVDDERKLCDAVARGLGPEHWSVAIAGNAAEARRWLASESFDLVILDWMLPDADGLELLEEARRDGLAAPVLMFTARGTLDDRIAGIERGADSYLVKPFAFAELVARCRALLRWPRTSADNTFACGDLTFDIGRRVAWRHGEEIPLTPSEADILAYFFSNNDRLVTHEMMAAELWRERVPGVDVANAIKIHMTRLRRKLERGTGPRLLHTVHGLGYRLGSEVEVRPPASSEVGRVPGGAATRDHRPIQSRPACEGIF